MKKNLFITILSLFILVISCQKEDRVTAPPARPYAEVYPEDLEKIEEFLALVEFCEPDSPYYATYKYAKKYKDKK